MGPQNRERGRHGRHNETNEIGQKGNFGQSMVRNDIGDDLGGITVP